MTVPLETTAKRGKLRSGIFLGLKVAVSIGLLVWILRRIGLASLLLVMATASPARLLLAALLLAASHLLGSWQWGRLLKAAGLDLPWGRVATYYFAGALGNLVLPTGTGGDLARIVGVGREGGRRGAAAGATVVDRLLGLGMLGAIGLGAALFGLGLGGSATGRVVLAAATANAALGLAGLLVVMSPASGRLLAVLGGVLPRRFRGRLGRLEDALARVRAAPGRGFLLLLALAVQATRILAHAQVARALDLELGLRYFFLFVPLLAVAVAVPISIGGIGVRESMGAVLFGLLGVSAAEASAMQLLAYFVAVVVSAPGAAILIGTGARREAGSSRAERPPNPGRESTR